MKSIEELIKELEDRKALLLYTLAEDESIYFPEILVGLVQELRGIVRILKVFKKGENGKFK